MLYPKQKVLQILLLISFVSLAQPKVTFTFDDGVTNDYPGYSFETWNNMILDHLNISKIKAIFFVTGNNKTDEKGKMLLNSWNEKGHKIANHTYSHVNYSSNEVSFHDFKQEFLKTDSIIKQYSNYTKLFRFPYSGEGNTQEKLISFRKFMKDKKYGNGRVTIDTSDWYIDSRLQKRRQENPNTDIEDFRKFYVDQIVQRAILYEELSYELTGRHIHHALLLHHNLTSALFLGDLIKAFKKEGWNILSGETTYTDPIYDKTPTHVGGSFLWGLAKDTGVFEIKLKAIEKGALPPKETMDHLGL